MMVMHVSTPLSSEPRSLSVNMLVNLLLLVLFGVTRYLLELLSTAFPLCSHEMVTLGKPSAVQVNVSLIVVSSSFISTTASLKDSIRGSSRG